MTRKVVLGFLVFTAMFVCHSSPVRSSLGARGKSDVVSLPYDTEVEYLESTGTQWIDTGIFCLKKYSFEFSVSVSYNGVSYEDYFGGSQSDSQAGWRFRRDGNSEKVLFFHRKLLYIGRCLNA